MKKIGQYELLTEFTNEHAGTSEWCKAQKHGYTYFVKRFLSPVYPAEDLGLPEEIFKEEAEFFDCEMQRKKALYESLQHINLSGALILPEEILKHDSHLCTITEFVTSNITPTDVCRLSEWQRLVLIRTLVLTIMDVHNAGIVHGDLKPTNTLITQNVETGACILKLIDFDSSYFRSSPPLQAEDIAGDMTYWAPEIYAKYEDNSIFLTEAIDLFALGIIIHHMWTGTYPHVPIEKTTIGQYVLSGKTPDLATSLPYQIKKVVTGLLDANPQDRTSLQHVYSALGELLDVTPVQMTILIPPEPQHIPPQPQPIQESQIEIVFCDDSNHVLKKSFITLSPGSSCWVKAKELEGYTLVSDRKVHVEVSRDRVPNYNPVRFVYQKKPRYIRSIVAVFVIVLVLYFVIDCVKKQNTVYPPIEPYTTPTPTVVTATPVPTHKPMHVTAESENNSYIYIQWYRQENAEYQIERRQADNTYWELLGGNSGSYFMDHSFEPGVVYEYRVTAYINGYPAKSDTSALVTGHQAATPTPTKKAATPTPSRKSTPTATPSALTVLWTDVSTTEVNRSPNVFYTDEKIYFYGTLVGGNRYDEKKLYWRAVHNGEYPIADSFDSTYSAGDDFWVWIKVAEKGTWTLEIYYFSNGSAVVIGRKTITVR